MADYFEHWLKIGEPRRRQAAEDLPRQLVPQGRGRQVPVARLRRELARAGLDLPPLRRRGRGARDADRLRARARAPRASSGLDRDRGGRGAERGPRRGARRARPDAGAPGAASATGCPTQIRAQFEALKDRPELSSESREPRGGDRGRLKPSTGNACWTSSEDRGGRDRARVRGRLRPPAVHRGHLARAPRRRGARRVRVRQRARPRSRSRCARSTRRSPTTATSRSARVLETNTDDWPFLVDSVSAALEARGEQVARLVHPIIGISREDGHITARLARPQRGPPRVGHALRPRAQADRRASSRSSSATSAVLLAVRSTVTDFGAMTQRVESMIALARRASARYDSDEVREAVDFLAWLLRGNFVLLGAREYEIRDDAYRCIPGSGLGILRRRGALGLRAARAAVRAARGAARAARTSGELLIVDKANARSPVHRHERMDYVGVRRVTPDGEIAGEARLLGLFTTKAYAEPASETPVLHRKLRRVLEAEDLIEGSHDYKGAVALFDTFPKDELFAAPVDDLRRAVVALLALEGTDRVRLLGRRGAGRPQRLVHPRAAARPLPGAARRARAQAVHAPLRAPDDVEAQHMLGEGARVRVHFLVHAPDGLPEVETRELEREVVQLARTWDDALRDALVERYGAARARLLRSIWAGTCPSTTRATRRPTTARWTSRCSSSWPRTGRSWSRCSRCAAHPRRALHARAEDRAGRRAADARGPRAARDRGDLDAAGRRRRDVGAGVPRARPGRAAAGSRCGRRPRGGAARGGPPRRRRDRQPQPARDHRRAGPRARWRSCARTASTASGSARASPRATRTTCWSRTRRSRPSSCATSSCASTRTSRPTRRPRPSCATRSWPTSRRSLARPRPDPAQPARR